MKNKNKKLIKFQQHWRIFPCGEQWIEAYDKMLNKDQHMMLQHTVSCCSQLVGGCERVPNNSTPRNANEMPVLRLRRRLQWPLVTQDSTSLRSGRICYTCVECHLRETVYCDRVKKTMDQPREKGHVVQWLSMNPIMLKNICFVMCVWSNNPNEWIPFL